jgi:hypothetical protein
MAVVAARRLQTLQLQRLPRVASTSTSKRTAPQ